MSTSISSVNAGSTAASESAVKKSTLSNETKSRLAELGISYTEGMTEAEANAKIAEAEAQNNQQNQEQDGDSSSQSDILSEAKTLAASMGIAVDSDDVDDILDDIGAELEVMLEEAEKNPAKLSQLSSYLSQLTSLDERYDYLVNQQENLFAAMDMVSTNNKISLGLE